MTSSGTDLTTRRGSGLWDKIAATLIRARFWVILFWLLAAAVAIGFLPPIQSQRGSGLRGLVPQHSEAIEAEIASFELFGFPLTSRTMIVQRDPQGLAPAAQARVYLRAINLNRQLYRDITGIPGALPITNTLGLFPSSSERGTTAITYLFFRPETDLSDRERRALRFSRLHIDDEGDSFVGITGAAPGRIAEGRLIKRTLPLVEAATLLLIVAIVAIHFRAIGAALLTLVAAGLAFVVATRGVAWLAETAGIGLPGELEPVLVVLLLGIVTDYSIFFLDGARDRLLRGGDKADAARRSAAHLIGIVLAAGLTVAAGTFSLYVATLEVFKSLGPGLAVTVLVSLSLSITFLPAAIAIFGRLLFWPDPRMTRGIEGSTRSIQFRERITLRASHRPLTAVIALATSALLLLPATQLKDTRLGFSIVSGLPKNAVPRVAASAAAKGFAPGIISPLLLVIRGRGRLERDNLAQLESIIEKQPGVAGVLGPSDIFSLTRRIRRLPRIEELLDGSADPAELALRSVLAESRNAARLMVILEDPPLGARAIATLKRLRAQMPAFRSVTGLRTASVAFAGDTALAEETIDQTLSDLRRIGIAVFFLDTAILMLFLRSVLAPLYVITVSILGFAATLGLTTWLFIGVLGQGSLSFFVPFAAAVLLISLGSDYSVFLVGRIWSEAQRRPLRRAIAVATPRASRAISVAGITLALSFAVLALVPLHAFRQFAFLMAAGILIDTFVVRSFLMPSTIAVFGRAGAWPRRFMLERDEGPSLYPFGSVQDRRQRAD